MPLLVRHMVVAMKHDVDVDVGVDVDVERVVVVELLVLVDIADGVLDSLMLMLRVFDSDLMTEV
jgi:hypothetical protein